MGTPVRVLIVDASDDAVGPMLRKIMDGGCEADHRRVDSALAFEAELARQDWDIIIADHGCPGLKLTHALTLLHDAGKDTPVIVVSDTPGEEQAVAAMRAGARDYLLKGQLDRLCEAVRRELAAVQDRRERREVDAAFRDIAENSPLGIVVAQDGRYVYTNRVLADLTGYTVEELLALPPETPIVHPDDLELVSRRMGERLAGVAADGSRTVRIIHKDGSVKHVEVHSFATTRGGRPAVRMVFIDVTDRERARHDLHDSHERYREIIALGNGVAYERDWTTNTFAFMDDGIEHLTGYSVEEITPEIFERIIDEHHVDRRAELPLYESLRRRSRSKDVGFYRAEYSVDTRDGRTVWVADSAVQLRGPDGRLSRTIGMLQDITDEKVVAQELTQSERHYREIIETAAGVPYRRNMVTDTYEFVGAGIEELVGIPAGDFTLDGLRGLIRQRSTPDDGSDAEVTERGVAFDRGRATRYHADYNIVTPEGDEKWLSDSAIAVTDPRTGHAQASLGILQDITQRKRNEQQLRDSLRINQTTLATMPSFLLVLGPELTILAANDRCPKGLAEGANAWEGQRISDVLPADLLAEHPVLDIISSVMSTDAQDELSGIRYESPARGDMYIDIRACGFTLDDRDQSRRVLLVIDDVTDERIFEEQARQASKLESIGTLAGGVAHDFNNILTGIGGYADLVISDERIPETCLADIKSIRELSKRAAGLTRQLLAFSRRQTMSPAVLDLNGLIEDLARMLTRIIGEDMVLELNLASDLGNVRVDPGQIEQVLMNLAVNARDAMPDGGAISIETSNTSIDEAYVAQHVGAKPGRYAAIAVSDSGCGMDASVLERIFEPFFTTKAVGDGTGLGLATAYGIVKQHNGNIWAYSEPGLGSTFRIYLPAVDDAIERDKDLALVDTPLTGAETILAVEDEHTVLRIVRRILTEFGYSVLTAASASEAERIFDENRDDISLLLADVIMPDVNGPALFETLRAKNAGLKVLYISGYTKRTATRAGGLPDDAPFLQKPFPPEVLARHVRDVLDA